MLFIQRNKSEKKNFSLFFSQFIFHINDISRKKYITRVFRRQLLNTPFHLEIEK
jgi:hypothetical protein